MPLSASGWSQVRSVAAIYATALTQGLSLGWSSPGIGQLKAGHGPFRPTLDEISWIASFFSLGVLAGSLAGAAVFARSGRRVTLLLGPVLLALSGLLTLAGSSPTALYVARMLGGAGHGVGVSFASIYVAEVAEAALRGRLILVVNLLLMAGTLLAFALGPVLPYRALGAMPLASALAAIALRAAWMRETPFYLATLGRADEALRELGALRAGTADDEVRAELAAIQKTVKQQLQAGGGSLRELLAAPAARRASLVCIVVSGSFAALGVPTLMAFTQLIVEEAGAPLSPALCSVLLVVVNVAAVLASMPVLDRFGRRPVLAGSALGNAASLAMLAVFLMARDAQGGAQSGAQVGASWLPLAALLGYMVTSGTGIVTLPHVLTSELLPQRAKSSVAPAAGALVSLSSFALHKSFIPVGRALGFGAPFLFFAATNLAYAAFVLRFVPETKGKTLAQVQEMLAAAAAADEKAKKRKDE